jgi:hypothetical protein
VIRSDRVPGAEGLAVCGGDNERGHGNDPQEG